MNFEYQLDKLDEMYFLKERHRKTNLIYFLLFALFYLAINIPMMMKRFWVFVTIYIIFVFLLAFTLWLCNHIYTQIELRIRQKNRKENNLTYHFSITKRGITESQGTFKKEVSWKDIKKIYIRKKYIFIEPQKNEIAFLFQRKTLGHEYDQLIQIITDNIKVKRSK